MKKKSFLIVSSILFSILAVIFSSFFVKFENSQQAVSQVPVVTEDAKIEQKQKIAEEYGKIPLHFEPNLGQTDERVKFLARGHGYSLFLTENEAVLSLQKRGEGKADGKTAVVRMRLDGANSSPNSNGLQQTESKSNYFIGNDAKKWQTQVPNYEKVKYESVYQGVDLVYYGNGQQLEYDFIVAPNTDPNQIKLKFDGIKSAEIEEQTGDLLLETEGGTIRQHKPFVYQEIEGARKEIASSYAILDNAAQKPENEFTVSFKLAEYDKSKELVIDPILVYGSYLGGNAFDEGRAITIDSEGNAYIVGSTYSRDFPTTPGTIKPELLTRPDLPTSHWFDAFVTKVNPNGTAIVYSTFFGGRTGSETGTGVEVDANGNALISGTTASTDLPTVNANQSTFGGTDDVFAAKLNPNGSALIYSTYIGGTNSDMGGKIALNRTTGDAVFAGTTNSPNFPTTPGAYRERLCDTPQSCSGISFTGSYIIKLSANGNPVYSTLFNASINDVALDSGDNAIVGGTAPLNFPATTGAFQTTSSGGVEGFVAKMNPAGSAMVFGTFLGGGLQSDRVRGVAVDSTGNIYATGQTQNTGFPTTPGAFDTTYNGGEDGFLTKLNPQGTALIYSTFLGGTGRDEPNAVGIGENDNAFVGGETTGPNSFPLRNSINGNSGSIFLTRFNSDGSALVFSTLLGVGGIYDLAVDGASNAYVTGYATNIVVTPGAFQTIKGDPTTTSARDAFIMKIGPTDENVTHYSISGTVIDQNNGFNNNYSPIVVTITGTVNRSYSLPYSSNGTSPFTFANLPAGGTYTVTVKKVGFLTDPENVVFSNLGANQFAEFTILRNREPEATITSPEHGTTYDAPASITIQATATDPDGDPIEKVEFVAYHSTQGSIPIGIDTEAPYEITWNNVPVGTWALYAIPYDNKGLRGQTQNVVHVFVVDSGPVSVSFTSPNEGQVFTAGDYVPIAVNVSSSVNRVEIRDQNNNLITAMNGSPWSTQWRVMEAGNYTLTATASNSQNQAATSAPVSIVVNPVNHRISGRILDNLSQAPVANVSVTLTSSTNTSINATMTTDSTGSYLFTDFGAHPMDSVKITPVLEGYEFNPEARNISLVGYVHWQNQNFTAIADNPISVVMTSPNYLQTFPAAATINMAANASTSTGSITKVEFFRAGNTGQPILIGTDTEAPYSFEWTNAPSGNHSLFARATNSEGRFNNSANIPIMVQAAPTTIRLQGDITDTFGNPRQGISVKLTGTANGNPINQTSISNFFGAYGFFNLPMGGDYTITPEAPNTTFTPPSFTVLNAVANNLDVDFVASGANQSPTVQINSPANGATFTMPVVIPVNVTASDPDGTVTHLSVVASTGIFNNTIAQSNNGTVNINWQPNQPGTYQLTATATDNGGLRTSQSISITVNQPAPVSISGRIVNRESQGIEEVSVVLKDYPQEQNTIATVMTDNNGNFTIPNVATFASYIVRVEKLNHTFAPQNRIMLNVSTSQTNADFTGTVVLQRSDFNGDSETDIAVWRPSDGMWYIQQSGNGGLMSVPFGAGSFGDQVIPGNYDGDQKMDIAVYRGGNWYIRKSSNGQVISYQFGIATDKPVPGDYDGDGKTDIAVFRPSNGTWYILRSSDGNYDFRTFGTDGDVPLAGDFDGDGITDLTVFRPSNGGWYVSQSSNGAFRAFAFGTSEDVPLVGDFDGDKKADFTVFRPSQGGWHIWLSSTNSYKGVQWGISTDVPVPGDYDRDGKTDLAVFRKATGSWYILRSSNGSFTTQNFGLNGDIPVPGFFAP